ncbi:MAG: hypothetical protein PHO67_04830 [Candidatus Omnitrophica bacterium]|nr:hypothetical protein [Candidatus Omnitrophota bacterium]
MAAKVEPLLIVTVSGGLPVGRLIGAVAGGTVISVALADAEKDNRQEINKMNTLAGHFL